MSNTLEQAKHLIDEANRAQTFRGTVNEDLHNGTARIIRQGRNVPDQKPYRKAKGLWLEPMEDVLMVQIGTSWVVVCPLAPFGIPEEPEPTAGVSYVGHLKRNYLAGVI